MGQRFNLDVSLLAGVSGLVMSQKSAISPLNVGAAPVLTVDQQHQLQQNGLTDAFGRMRVESLPAFDALASARAYARIRLSGMGHALDYAVYFGAPDCGDGSISVTAVGLEVEFPANPADKLVEMEGITGASSHLNQDWEVSLPPLEGLVLAALMDQRRRAVLRAIAEDKPALPAPSDPIALAQVINQTVELPQWLVSVVKSIGGIRLPVTALQIQPACEALVTKGLAWQENNQVFPTQAAMMMADRILLVGNVISMDAANVNEQGAVAAQRCTCLQSGLADTLHFELFEGQVHFQCISAAQLLEMLRFYLSTSDAVPAIPLAPKDFYLAITAGSGVGQTFSLMGEMLLGRGADVDIHLLDIKASRHHAAVKKLEQGFELSDLGSTNGTALNGETISAPMLLKEGDDISIGETHFKVMAGVAPSGEKPENERTVFASELGKAGAPMPETTADAEAVPEIGWDRIEPMTPITVVDPLPAVEPVEALLVKPEIPFEPEILPEPLPPTPYLPELETAAPAPELGYGLAPDVAFITEVPAGRRCPTCASEVSDGAKFCGVCGTKL